MTRTRILGIAGAIMLAVVSYVIVLSLNGVPFQTRHTVRVALPAGSPPIDANGQVRIGGQRAGIVESTAPERGGGRMTLRIDPRFWPLPDGTRVRVRVKPASGLVYVELDPAGAGTLAEGATIPATRVEAGTTLPEAAEAFDAATRDALARTAVVSGAALVGQGQDLNATIGRIRPTLDDGLPLVQALTRHPGDISGLLQGSQTVAGALSSADLDTLLADGATSLSALAAPRDALGAAVDATPGLEQRLAGVAPGVQRLLDQADTLMAALNPLTDDLTAQLPAARRLLAASPQLRAAATKLSAAATLALAGGPQTMAALAGPTRDTGPAAAALSPITDELSKYKSDLLAGVHGLQAVTSRVYPDGATAPNNPALRFAPILGCHRGRDPYPAPGQSVRDQAPRSTC